MPLLESCRFRIKPKTINQIVESIESTGLCVIEKVWDQLFLKELCQHGNSLFKLKDKAIQKNNLSTTEIPQYFGAFYSIEDHVMDEEFYTCILQSKFPYLFKKLFNGDFALMRNERVLRRVDPIFPLRFSAFHTDGQLKDLACRGLHSKREFTIWTPLVNVVDDKTPRLMLIDKKDTENFKDFYMNNAITLPNQVKVRIHVLSTLNIDLEKKYQPELLIKRKEIYSQITYRFLCYAPKIKLGDCIIFDRDIWHSSFIPENFSKKRISLDYRIVGDHIPTEDMRFDGKFFRSKKHFLFRKDIFFTENYRVKSHS